MTRTRKLWFLVRVLGIASSGSMATLSSAQFTGNYQTNVINGVFSNWVNTTYAYTVGGYGNQLQIINGGVLSNQSGVAIGWIGSNDSAVVSGPGSLWVNQKAFEIGVSTAFGSLLITNGGRVVNNYESYVGWDGWNNTALVTGTGSVWNAAGGLYVGHNGYGNRLIIDGGGTAQSSLSRIGYWIYASNNHAVVTGPGSTLNSYTLYVGSDSSYNSLTISNEGSVIGEYAYIGSGATNNRVLVTGAGSVWNLDRDLQVGAGGVSMGNSLVVSNGATMASGYRSGYNDGTTYIGNGGNGNSVLVTGAGSVWSNYGSLFVGYAGGTNNSLAINNGGTVVASDAVVAPHNLLSLGGGNLIVANGLVISNAATLKGTGTIFADLTLAGTLAPGNSPGVLTISGNLTLQPTAVLDIQLGGTTQGVDYDAIFVNGSVALDGLLQVSFINGFETNVLNSEGFIVLQGASPLGGTFSNIVSNQYGDSQVLTAGGEGYFDVEYIGNAVTLSGYHGVPEPSTLALCGLASLVLLAARRRSSSSLT